MGLTHFARIELHDKDFGTQAIPFPCTVVTCLRFEMIADTALRQLATAVSIAKILLCCLFEAPCRKSGLMSRDAHVDEANSAW